MIWFWKVSLKMSAKLVIKQQIHVGSGQSTLNYKTYIICLDISRPTCISQTKLGAPVTIHFFFGWVPLQIAKFCTYKNVKIEAGDRLMQSKIQ